MKFVVNNHNIFLIVAVCFFASTLFVYLVGKIATYFGLVDIQVGKGKVSRKKPIPTLCGIAIFLSFLLGYMLFGPNNNLMLSILISSFLVLLLGIFDDISKTRENCYIKPIYRFVIHVIIAAIIVFYGDLELKSASMFGFNLNFGIFAPLVSMFIIVGAINAINLIDGIDGLSSGIASIYFLTIATIGFILNKFGGLDIILSLIMLGSCLGYLVHNFPPAKALMGDTGSTFIGLMIAVIILLGFKTLTLTSLVVPLFILAIPIFDTLFAIIRRKLKHKSVGEGDSKHFHHQILKLTKSKTKTILIIYGINIIFSCISILYTLNRTKEVIVSYIIVVFAVIWLILKTDIIFDKKEEESKK